jgi:hypothetical protein
MQLRQRRNLFLALFHYARMADVRNKSRKVFNQGVHTVIGCHVECPTCGNVVLRTRHTSTVFCSTLCLVWVVAASSDGDKRGLREKAKHYYERIQRLLMNFDNDKQAAAPAPVAPPNEQPRTPDQQALATALATAAVVFAGMDFTQVDDEVRSDLWALEQALAPFQFQQPKPEPELCPIPPV